MVGSCWGFDGAFWRMDSYLRLGSGEQLAQAGFSYVSSQCSAEVMTQRYDSVLRSLIGSVVAK